MLLFLVVDTKTFCSHKCLLWLKSNHKLSHEFPFFSIERNSPKVLTTRMIATKNWGLTILLTLEAIKRKINKRECVIRREEKAKKEKKGGGKVRSEEVKKQIRVKENVWLGEKRKRKTKERKVVRKICLLVKHLVFSKLGLLSRGPPPFIIWYASHN